MAQADKWIPFVGQTFDNAQHAQVSLDAFAKRSGFYLQHGYGETAAFLRSSCRTPGAGGGDCPVYIKMERDKHASRRKIVECCLEHAAHTPKEATLSRSSMYPPSSKPSWSASSSSSMPVPSAATSSRAPASSNTTFSSSNVASSITSHSSETTSGTAPRESSILSLISGHLKKAEHQPLRSLPSTGAASTSTNHACPDDTSAAAVSHEQAIRALGSFSSDDEAHEAVKRIVDKQGYRLWKGNKSKHARDHTCSRVGHLLSTNPGVRCPYNIRFRQDLISHQWILDDKRCEFDHKKLCQDIKDGKIDIKDLVARARRRKEARARRRKEARARRRHGADEDSQGADDSNDEDEDSSTASSEELDEADGRIELNEDADWEPYVEHIAHRTRSGLKKEVPAAQTASPSRSPGPALMTNRSDRTMEVGPATRPIPEVVVPVKTRALASRAEAADIAPPAKKSRLSAKPEASSKAVVIEISDSESEPEAEVQPEPEATSDVDIVLPKVKIESDTLFSKLPLPVQNALRKYGTPHEACLRASLRDKLRIGAFLLELQTEMQRKVQEDRSFQDCILHDVDRIAATVTIRETFWGT